MVFTLFDDFIYLLWPKTCVACGRSLFKHEENICNICYLELPKTNFHLYIDNPVSRLFWGRVKIEAAASFLYFNKGNKVQHIVHSLKYKGNKEIGIFLGKIYGEVLKYSPLFNIVDEIIPVPLHYKKFIYRGYNQSEMFGIGLSESMGKPLNTTTLLRDTFTETQTRKTRFNRWENVSEVFTLKDPLTIDNKHILLVDDVITTGATIEACTNALLKAQNTKVSLVSIACAIN
ncbi:MAG TPA: phosphoribosyltransferase family protein [Bacteroidales bacterium]|nr:phosphoribosyltransferase family protein [Bacteroidales bacterium]